MRRRDAEGNRPHSTGQSLVEFALLCLPLMILIFGLLDLGRAVFAYDSLTNAARQGARAAIVNQNDSATAGCDRTSPSNWSYKRCAVIAAATLGVDPNDVTLSYVDCDEGGRKLGCVVRVTVSYDHQPLTPIVSNITFSMQASSEMPIERVYPPVNPE